MTTNRRLERAGIQGGGPQASAAVQIAERALRSGFPTALVRLFAPSCIRNCYAGSNLHVGMSRQILGKSGRS